MEEKAKRWSCIFSREIYNKSVTVQYLHCYITDVYKRQAQGDLSENFEYYAAKKEKNQNESRIRYLERMLKTAVVISEESKEDEVGLNNTVTLYMEDDDEEETYRLVTSIRGNSLSGLISTESPIGKAILGHKVGDRVEIKVSDDFSYYVVIRKIDKTVSYTHLICFSQCISCTFLSF